MAALAIIPARYGSTRLPGKALLNQTGRPLIQHVVESVSSARLIARVVVATDDRRIVNAVAAFGGEAVITGADCRTGTDRIAEAADILALADDDIVVNVQGDEPEMPGWCVDRAIELLKSSGADIATLATLISASEATLANLTKVVFGAGGRALYFSRARIPVDRDATGSAVYHLHHGIYAYCAGFVRAYAKLPSTPAEEAEKLEQLRALEHGHSIAVGVVEYRGARIDTPDEYAAFVNRWGRREKGGPAPAPAGPHLARRGSSPAAPSPGRAARSPRPRPGKKP
jgi:3-deoxy-manno-octulosonate cytidylyltransferase (CMP-KDO synthetase)